MANWDEFVSGTRKTFNKAAIKVNEVADCAADSIKIETLKIKLSERYEELGRIVYEGMSAGKADKEKISEKVDQIEAINAEIEALKEKKKKKAAEAKKAEQSVAEAEDKAADAEEKKD